MSVADIFCVLLKFNALILSFTLLILFRLVLIEQYHRVQEKIYQFSRTAKCENPLLKKIALVSSIVVFYTIDQNNFENSFNSNCTQLFYRI